jgi:hypothetical protein
MGLHVDVQVLLRDTYVKKAWMLSWRIGIGVTWYMCVSNSYLQYSICTARATVPISTEHSTVGRDGQEFESTEHVQEIPSFNGEDNSRTTRDMFDASDTIQEESQDSNTRAR